MKRLILMGPIGCGKSTMIQTVLGQDIARAGGFLTVRKLDGTQLLGFGLVSAWACMIAHNLLLFVLFLLDYLRKTWNPLERA